MSVIFHPQTYQEFFAEILSQYPGLDESLLADFSAYKQSGLLPSYFGKDVPYVEPHLAFSAHLMHIHLKFPPDAFPKNLPQIDRACRKGEPHKDAALVYVAGELEEDEFCLLAVLHPNAHAKARNEKVMRYLARLAKDFRESH